MRTGSGYQHVLRVLFPPAVAWALLSIFGEYFDSLRRLNPFTERSPLHDPIEELLSWLPVLLLLATGVWMVCRWPHVLRLPPSELLVPTAARLIVHLIGWSVAVFAGTVVVGFLLYDPSRDAPEQRYLGVWMSGFFVAPAIAPLAALFTVWRSSYKNAGLTG